MGTLARSLVAVAWMFVAPALADVADKGFPGEVTIVVGFSPGGGDEGGVSSRGAASRLQPQPGYDQTARLYARHLGSFLPGQPRVLLRHLPGAASMKAAGLIAREAPADGSVLGVVSSAALLAPLLGNPAAEYKPQDFSFVGARSADEYVCAADGEAGIKTVADLARPGLALGSTAPGRRPYVHASLLKGVTGAPVRIVSGYRDANEMLLALRRSEVSVLCGLSLEVFRAGLGTWLTSGRLKPLMRVSPPWLERLSAVPRAQEMAAQAGLGHLVPGLDWMAMEGAFAWTLTAPSRLPAERLSVLRKAFAAMQTDRDYRREAARRNLEVMPVAPERLEEAAAELIAAPPPVLDIVKKLSAAP
jgi:tripartite-type tricarboxylate transporter receptor subunit TctC